MMYVKITGSTPKDGCDKDTVERFWRHILCDVEDVSYTETFTKDGKRIVNLTVLFANGDSTAYLLTGAAYVMSENGKTIDTIHGGDEDGTIYAAVNPLTNSVSGFACDAKE